VEIEVEVEVEVEVKFKFEVLLTIVVSSPDNAFDELFNEFITWWRCYKTFLRP